MVGYPGTREVLRLLFHCGRKERLVGYYRTREGKRLFLYGGRKEGQGLVGYHGAKE